jgi:hypothetical protein
MTAAAVSIPVIMQALKFLGFDPSVIIAGLVVSVILALVKPVKNYIETLIAKIKTGHSLVLQGAALPVLEAIDKDLDALKGENPDLQDVAKLIAGGIVDSATDKAHAKVIAAGVMKTLEKELAARIKTKISQ